MKTKCLDPKCQLDIVAIEEFRGQIINVCEVGHRTAYYLEDDMENQLEVA